MKSPILAIAAAMCLAAPAFAQVRITDPWVRGTVAGQTATGAFMKLDAAEETRLVEARSPVAGAVEIHEMTMIDNVMRMRAVPGLGLTAGKPLELKPGGYHLMLMNLKQAMKQGDTVPITLVFEGKGSQRQSIEVKVPVRSLTAGSGTPARPMEHQHKH